MASSQIEEVIEIVRERASDATAEETADFGNARTAEKEAKKAPILISKPTDTTKSGGNCAGEHSPGKSTNIPEAAALAADKSEESEATNEVTTSFHVMKIMTSKARAANREPTTTESADNNNQEVEFSTNDEEAPGAYSGRRVERIRFSIFGRLRQRKPAPTIRTDSQESDSSSDSTSNRGSGSQIYCTACGLAQANPVSERRDSERGLMLQAKPFDLEALVQRELWRL